MTHGALLRIFSSRVSSTPLAVALDFSRLAGGEYMADHVEPGFCV
jgi:hypothetical protein